jgi:hypothetical protein
VRRGQLACIQVTAKKRLFRHEHVEHFLRTHEREPRAKPVDANRAARVTLPPKASASRSKGGDTHDSGNSVKRTLLKEMREWR